MNETCHKQAHSPSYSLTHSFPLSIIQCQCCLPFPNPHGSFILSKSWQQSPAPSQNSSQKHNTSLTKSSIPQLLFLPEQQSSDPPFSLWSQHFTGWPSPFWVQRLLAKLLRAKATAMAKKTDECLSNSIAAKFAVLLLPDVWSKMLALVLFTGDEQVTGPEGSNVWQLYGRAENTCLWTLHTDWITR